MKINDRTFRQKDIWEEGQKDTHNNFIGLKIIISIGKSIGNCNTEYIQIQSSNKRL